jgi:N-terminal domain of (some) glycogen debranching enzymes
MGDRHARDIMELRQITVLRGRTFMVSDVRGDVEVNPAQPTGLFYRDMRHLSRWELRLNGRPLIALAGDAVDDDEAVVYLQEPTGSLSRNPTVSIVRRRRVGDDVREWLEVTNHDSAPIALQVTVLFDADFADIFEVRDRLAKRGRMYREVGDGFVVLGHARGDFARETRISAGDGFYTQHSVDFRLELGPGQCWRREIEISVAASAGGTAPAQRRRPDGTPTGPDRRREWLTAVPDLTTDSGDLRELYRRSLADLAALRFQPDAMTAATLPAAGLPWFMALFGRDSLIVSYQALPFLPELAATTLRTLAALQAVETDDFRDAEPGKLPSRRGSVPQALVTVGVRLQGPHQAAEPDHQGLPFGLGECGQQPAVVVAQVIAHPPGRRIPGRGQGQPVEAAIPGIALPADPAPLHQPRDQATHRALLQAEPAGQVLLRQRSAVRQGTEGEDLGHGHPQAAVLVRRGVRLQQSARADQVLHEPAQHVVGVGGTNGCVLQLLHLVSRDSCSLQLYGKGLPCRLSTAPGPPCSAWPTGLTGT